MSLKRTLNLLDATAVGVGAIIGAGIFVALGIAIGYAGPAIIISIIIAGIVASFTAFSFAELGSAIPKEGGAYQYTFELISPHAAFLLGCLWLFAQIVAGAAVSLGFASYIVAIFPAAPYKVVAVAIALVLTGLNIVGIKQSTSVNNVLVAVKIAILCLFVAVGIFQVQPQNFAPFSPNGVVGILQGAGFIFFAYLGYGRIATLGEEVKKPEKTLPLAILIALAIAVAIYILTALTATGLSSYQTLAQSGSPIAEAAKVTGNFALVSAVSFGALIATASVILANIIGVSRVSFAMARNGQLPKSIARVSERFGTPYVSVLLMGVLLAVLAFTLDLKQTIAITSFAILLTHVFVNFCALRLRKKMPDATKFRAPFYPLIPVLGLLSCGILMFSLPLESWFVAAVVVVVSAVLYRIFAN
ncbi:amino acid permease [Candidatus Bathyarchaeota archaeon A05DMB-2]|nr:amino acid permease [Candidatus Bathyarchaeota archaeon A05DMB-2]